MSNHRGCDWPQPPATSQQSSMTFFLHSKQQTTIQTVQMKANIPSKRTSSCQNERKLVRCCTAGLLACWLACLRACLRACLLALSLQHTTYKPTSTIPTDLCMHNLPSILHCSFIAHTATRKRPQAHYKEGGQLRVARETRRVALGDPVGSDTSGHNATQSWSGCDTYVRPWQEGGKTQQLPAVHGSGQRQIAGAPASCGQRTGHKPTLKTAIEEDAKYDLCENRRFNVPQILICCATPWRLLRARHA